MTLADGMHTSRIPANRGNATRSAALFPGIAYANRPNRRVQSASPVVKREYVRGASPVAAFPAGLDVQTRRRSRRQQASLPAES